MPQEVPRSASSLSALPYSAYTQVPRMSSARFDVQAFGYTVDEDSMFCVKLMANFAGV